MTGRGVERLLSEGQRLLRQGRWDEAERVLQQTVEGAPEYRWPRLYLALARADAGRADEALPEIDRAIALSPPSAVVLVFRGRVLCDAERNDAALDACRQARELDPHYTIACGYEALALLQKGEVAGAAARWKQGPAEPPSALLGRMLLAAERLACGRFPPSAAEPGEEGLPETTAASEEQELPEAAVEKPGARSRLPRAATSALKRARHAYARERLADAQQAYVAAVRADPALSEAWLELAIVSYEMEAYEDARQALERYRAAAGRDETDPHYRAYMAGCAAKLGSPETALELLEGADARQPVVPYARGLAMLALDRIPEARHAFVQFAAMAPRLAQTRIQTILNDQQRNNHLQDERDAAG